jgi:P-type conjugative transfer protein TrbL
MNDGGLLDNVLNSFTNAISGAWGPNLSAYLLPLLLALVVLQFGLIAIEAVVARDVPLLLMHILLGIIRVAIVVAIFQHAFDWGNAIVQTGQIIGTEVSGLAPTSLKPSGVFNTGLSVAQTIMQAKAHGSWYNELFQDVEFLLCGTAVGAAWLVASLLYLGALLEGTLLVYAGPLVIAFTPLTWTFDLFILWGKSLLQMAFKIALILMTLAVGIVLADEWVAATTTAGPTLTTNVWNLLIAVIQAVLFAWFTWKVPNKLSGLAGGAAVLGFTEGIIAMGGQAGGQTVSNTLSSSSGGGAGGGSGSAGGGGQGGALVSSEGLLPQAARAAADAGKALAQKVQAALTK